MRGDASFEDRESVSGAAHLRAELHAGGMPVRVPFSPRDLVEDVRRARDDVRAEMGRFGPELTQSGLLAMLELRLPDTYSHAERVARSSVAMARAMRLADQDVRAIRQAALLHDIGKIAIPLTLLSRRGRLDHDEVAVLQMHVTIGADLLSGVPALAGVAAMVVATHEHFDGTGYPSQLAGTDIPLGARIIAVADCYDAMIAPRPYCEPITREQAYDELLRCAGSHFDPAVVAKWVALRTSPIAPAVIHGGAHTASYGAIAAGKH